MRAEKVVIVLLGVLFVIAVAATADAGMGGYHQEQFPYPYSYYEYENMASGCGGCIYPFGIAFARDVDESYGYFYVGFEELSTLVNTQFKMNGVQHGYLYFNFYDDEETNLWSGPVPVSHGKFNANWDRLNLSFWIDDTSLREATGGDYSSVAAILSGSSFCSLRNNRWQCSCEAVAFGGPK